MESTRRTTVSTRRRLLAPVLGALLVVPLLAAAPRAHALCEAGGPEDPTGGAVPCDDDQVREALEEAVAESGAGPRIWIEDGGAAEGDSGTRTLELTVCREDGPEASPDLPAPVLVSYSTAELDGDGAAEAGSDYTTTSGEVEVPPGCEATIGVEISGDGVHEVHDRDWGGEIFEVRIHDPVPGDGGDDGDVDPLIADGSDGKDGVGVAAILEDDPSPALTIGDATVEEGPPGARTRVDFPVTLSGPANREITARYATVDFSASVDGGDYLATSGTLRFPAGTSGTVDVGVIVNGDDEREGSEAFVVAFTKVTGPVDGARSDTAAVGIIRDDDAPGGSGEGGKADGGSGSASGTVAGGAPPRRATTPDDRGYWVLGPSGRVEGFGTARDRIASVEVAGDATVVALASDQSTAGLWLLDETGGVFSVGTAGFHGSVPALRAEGIAVGGARSVDIASTPSGDGYWILDRTGGIHAFGDAGYFGSLPGRRAAGADIPHVPAVSIASNPGGDGYWILDEDGGVHSFGAARYRGSVPELRSQGTAVGATRFTSLTPAPGGDGYWILDEDGGVHSFGSVPYHGSIPGLRAAGHTIGAAPTSALEATADGGGYWIFDETGGVFTFGDARFHGSIPGGPA